MDLGLSYPAYIYNNVHFYFKQVDYIQMPANFFEINIIYGPSLLVDFYFKQVDFSLHIYTHVAREWTFQTNHLFF